LGALALFGNINVWTLLVNLKLCALRSITGCRLRDEERTLSGDNERAQPSRSAALAVPQDKHEYLDASQQTGHTTGEECARSVSSIFMYEPPACTDHVVSRSFSSSGLRGSWACRAWRDKEREPGERAWKLASCAAIAAATLTHMAAFALAGDLVYAAALTRSGSSSKLTHASAKVGAAM